MGSTGRWRSWKDRPFRQTAREHVYAMLPQRGVSGGYHALVGAVSGAVVVSKTQTGPKMKAIQVHKTGGPEVLELRELPDPIPHVGEALVRVHTAGVNFMDVYFREGK